MFKGLLKTVLLLPVLGAGLIAVMFLVIVGLVNFKLMVDLVAGGIVAIVMVGVIWALIKSLFLQGGK